MKITQPRRWEESLVSKKEENINADFKHSDSSNVRLCRTVTISSLLGNFYKPTFINHAYQDIKKIVSLVLCRLFYTPSSYLLDIWNDLGGFVSECVRIVILDRIPNTEYIWFLKKHRIPNSEYIRFLKNDRIRIPNSAIRTLLFE